MRFIGICFAGCFAIWVLRWIISTIGCSTNTKKKASSTGRIGKRNTGRTGKTRNTDNTGRTENAKGIGNTTRTTKKQKNLGKVRNTRKARNPRKARREIIAILYSE